MNFIIKTLVSAWLIVALLLAWIGCAFMGFFFAFSQYDVMYEVTPYMGLTIAICIIKFGWQFLKTDPTGYMVNLGKRYVSKFKT